MSCHVGFMGKPQAWSGGCRNKGEAWPGAFTVIPVGNAGQSRIDILGLARLESFWPALGYMEGL